MSKKVSLLLTMALAIVFLSRPCGVDVFAAEKTENQPVQMKAEMVSFKETDDGFYSVMSIGPIGEIPTGLMAGESGKHMTGSAFFTITVPSGKTLNKLYLLGNGDGYTSMASVIGAGGVNTYRAGVNGNWYRVSGTNLGVSAGKSITVHVTIDDATHQYYIAIFGRQ